MTEPTNLQLERFRRSMDSPEHESNLFSKIVPLAIESLSKIAAGNRDGIERMGARECLNTIRELVRNHQKGKPK